MRIIYADKRWNATEQDFKWAGSVSFGWIWAVFNLAGCDLAYSMAQKLNGMGLEHSLYN